MFRALILATLLLASAGPVADQAQGILHIKVVLVDAEQKPTAVSRHALLISDTPPSAAPRRILTGPDGTVQVALRPGLYTVESDRAVAFNGKAYQWIAMVDVPADGTASLELTQDNAEVEAVTATASAAAVENDPSFLLTRWQDSVVAVWTATTRTSGFVVDTRGLVVTSQRAIGAATSAEVQFSPAVKVAAQVLTADPVRDVAVLRVDSTVAGSVRPIAMDCAQAANAPAVEQELFTIVAPLRGPKNLVSGAAKRVQKQVLADLRLSPDSSGGPVFTAAGAVAGVTATAVDTNDRTDDVRIVSVAEVCEVLRSAEGKMASAPSPSGALLPVEQLRQFPINALDEAANRRVSGSIPYQMSSAEFDIAFITPVLVHAAERRWQQAVERQRTGTPRAPDVGEERVRLLTEFGHWSRYFEDFPPVLLVRVTPKLVEGFWTKVARGAAGVQGIALPPFKRLTSGFSRLRALCGADEVPPIHPFKLAHRINDREITHEGLYVFDPGALGPQCGTVTLVLYSEKEPEKADTRAVDPKIVQQFWEDFAAHRALPPSKGPDIHSLVVGH